MKLKLLPFDHMPPEWADGRRCLVCDFLGEWRVAKFDRHYGWLWYDERDLPGYPYDGDREVITPVYIAELPNISDLETDDVDA